MVKKDNNNNIVDLKQYELEKARLLPALVPPLRERPLNERNAQSASKRNNFTAVPDLRQRSSISYATAKAVEYLKQGIGQSKRAHKRRLGVSPFIHGYDTLKRYVGIFNNFIETVVTPDGVTMLDKITVGHVDAHFENLLDSDCSESTVDVNASALVKFFTVFRMYEVVKHIDNNRYVWKASAVPLSRTMPFVDPERVISSMRYPYQEGAIIQYLTGARVADIRKVAEWVANNPMSYTILIRKSKGGRTRTLEYAGRMDAFFRVRSASEALIKHIGQDSTGWIKYLKEYTDAVRNAARTNHEIYCGPHAFRVNYAEDRYNRLNASKEESDEAGEKKTLTTITEELGHSRISMAKYYIPQYRR